MAALNTADLEVLVEAAINNRKVGMELLNALRVANGKDPHPATYGRGDLNQIHDSEWRAALAGVQADVDTSSVAFVQADA
ncbi:hypothetical protein ACKI1I_35765 [Streptomyces turgidiscabies]|uniref:hypothetical protein n=1 Tax=Streptomyces turgidiscabies TaxID=85558 RepID=UPI0038F64377